MTRHILRLALVLVFGLILWQQGEALSAVSWLTPKPADAEALLPPLLRLNEFMPRPNSDWNGDGSSNTLDSYIEIQNTSSDPISLTGFSLDDEAGNGSSDPYPLSGTLQPGQIAVYFRSVTDINLNHNEDEVRLLGPGGSVADAYAYEDAQNDQAWSRDTQGNWHDDWAPTPGQPNQQLPPPTHTRTATPSRTATATPTASATLRPSATAAATTTPVPSPTRTSGPGPSSTPAPTGTAGPSPTRTASATPQQPSVTPSASPNPPSATPGAPAIRRLFVPLVRYPGHPIVINGTFDSGTLAGWTSGASNPAFPVRAISMGGDYAAQFGNPAAACNGGAFAAGAAWLYQTIRVPDHPTPTLSFRYRLISQDDQRFERLRMIVRDAAGNPLEEMLVIGAPQPATLCDAPPRDLGWRTVTVSLAAFRSQNVQLYFELRSTDNTSYFNTWGYVDDVSVVGSN